MIPLQFTCSRSLRLPTIEALTRLSIVRPDYHTQGPELR